MGRLRKLWAYGTVQTTLIQRMREPNEEVYHR